ncbi:cytochrome P450 [Penicillium frequentans]|uniref:Cytochrome P450 n=1 Tax=Penicillium frequentans TaxID=3151616 RepID=A0AAD6CVK9_9EURO|nr:cytochrome P450 [Penicillium glabrum]
MISSFLNLSLAAGLGLISHRFYFIHGEHDRYADSIARVAVLAFGLITFYEWHIEASLSKAVIQAISLAAAYCGALFTSMFFYRLVQSPLTHLPGPFWAKVTKLYHVGHILRADNYRYMNKLFHQYGDVIRTGPNEVTLFTPEAFNQIYGPDSRCIRGVYYDMMLPLVSLVTTRHKHIHTHKRKLWDQGFSIKALEALEPKVYEYADELVHQLRQRLKTPVEIGRWFEYFTFDLMGLVGFNYKFNLLQTQKHVALDMYNAGHPVLGVVTPAPWIYHLTAAIPYGQEGYHMFARWAEGGLREKLKEPSGQRDVLNYVIEDARQRGPVEQSWKHILGDYILFITAGSDPQRQVLTNALYYLIRYPEHLSQVRSELSGLEDIRNYKSLQYLTHFNAIIKETLRLNPRREDCFVNATDFIPERFSTKPELILDKKAWQPWSLGEYQCVGKNLGLMEIRVALALLVMQFDWEFAPGEDGQQMFEGLLDFFTTVPGPLNVVIKERSIAPTE